MIQRFEQDTNVIYWGDALETLRNEVETASVDLVFVDPPYNIGKQFSDFHDKWDSEDSYVIWAHQWMDECIRVLKPTGTMYIMTSTQAMPHFDIYLRKKLIILSRIVWYYDSSGVQARKYYGSMYEPILHCVKDKTRYTFNANDIKIEAKTGSQRKLIDYRKTNPTQYNTDKVPGNVWYFPRVRYRMDEYEDHASQKPETLLNRIIRASSNEGDVILDPFAGTFTTAAVAQKLQRQSISIESQEAYVKIGLRRVLNMQSYNGEVLRGPVKTYTRKNRNGNHTANDQLGDLFDGNNETRFYKENT